MAWEQVRRGLLYRSFFLKKLVKKVGDYRPSTLYKFHKHSIISQFLEENKTVAWSHLQ